MVSKYQTETVARLEATLAAGRVPDRSKSFAQDLVRKGKTRNLSDKQMYWVEKLAQDNTEEATAEREANMDDRIVALKEVEHPTSFVSSLIGQYESKGNLSDSQWAWVEKIVAEEADRKVVREKARIEREEREAKMAVTFTFNGYEPVEEMMTLAADTLKKPKWTLTTHKGGKITLFYNRKDESVEVGHGGFYGVMKDGVFTTNGLVMERGDVVPMLEAFKADPSGFAAYQGHLTGHCCFCARHLSDERSTTHGYGPICADRYGLVWDMENARAIQAIRAEKVSTVWVETNAEGWQVVDKESGDVLATFKTSEAARNYADEFTTVKVIL
jgi:hypothetical protein